MEKVLLVVGVVCLQAAFGELTDDDFRSAHKECFEELNLDIDLLKNNVNEDWTVTEGNHEINSFYLCTYRKVHLVNDDDTLDIDKYKVSGYFANSNLKLVNHTDSTTNAIHACKSVQGSDAGDILVKHYNCIINYFKTID